MTKTETMHKWRYTEHLRTGHIHRLIYVVGIALGLLLSGCSTVARKELPVPIQFSLSATPTANPSVSGRPSPVVVSIYELRNSATFLAADFFSLFKDDRNVLGEDRVSRQEYVLQPGETRLVRRRSDLSTRFIGVVVGYRDIESSVWRSVVPIPAPHQAGLLWGGSTSPERRLLITIDRRSVSVVDGADREERYQQ
jgi:type VI secretion system protein VasD